MANEEFKIYANYFAIIIPVFAGLIGVFFLIPKFNPKNQYKDFKNAQRPDFLLSKQAFKLYLQGAIAFIVAFGAIFGILYLVMQLDQRGIKLF